MKWPYGMRALAEHWRRAVRSPAAFRASGFSDAPASLANARACHATNQVYGGNQTTAVAASKQALSTNASHRSHRRGAELQPTATHARPAGARNPLKLQLGSHIRTPTTPTDAASAAYGPGRAGAALSLCETDICSSLLSSSSSPTWLRGRSILVVVFTDIRRPDRGVTLASTRAAAPPELSVVR